MRTDLTFEIPPGLIASSISSTGASRTASHAVEAVAQAQEGDVAVAVVGRLREHGQHQLAERVAVGLHHRDPVHRAQALAHRAHAAGSGSAPGGRHAAKYRPRADGPGHRAPRHARRPARCSGAAPRAASRPCSTCTACRRARDDWVAFLERTGGLAPDLPGFGRSGKRGDGDFTMPGYDRFVEAFLDHAEVERVRLVVHDWGAVGPAVGPALPRARRAPGRDQRRPAAARLPLAPRRARCGARGASARWSSGSPRAGPGGGAPAARWPTSPGRTSTRAPSARSCSSTARARRTRSPRAGLDLGRIDCPALVVWGDRDPYIPRALRRRLRGRARRRRRGRCTSPTPGTGPGSTGRMPSIASPRSWTPRAVPAWALAAVVAARLPRAGPAERGPRGAGVPRRPRPRAVGQRLVRRPPHARLQRAASRRWRRCSARGSSGR